MIRTDPNATIPPPFAAITLPLMISVLAERYAAEAISQCLRARHVVPM